MKHLDWREGQSLPPVQVSLHVLARQAFFWTLCTFRQRLVTGEKTGLEGWGRSPSPGDIVAKTYRTGW